MDWSCSSRLEIWIVNCLILFWAIFKVRGPFVDQLIFSFSQPSDRANNPAFWMCYRISYSHKFTIRYSSNEMIRVGSNCITAAYIEEMNAKNRNQSYNRYLNSLADPLIKRVGEYAVEGNIYQPVAAVFSNRLRALPKVENVTTCSSSCDDSCASAFSACGSQSYVFYASFRKA